MGALEQGTAPAEDRRWLAGTAVVGAGAWLAFGVVNASHVYVSMLDHGHSYGRLVAYNVLAWGTWALLTPLVFRLAARFPPIPPRPVPLAVHALAAVAAGVTHLATSAALVVLVRPYDVRNVDDFAANFLGALWVKLPSELLIYALVLGLGAAADASRRLHRRELEAGRLEVQLAEAKLHALELQLRPHFLFNTLHAVTGFVRAGQNREAVEMIVRLSELLQQTLEIERRPLIPLARELDLLRAYLAIERIRFSDRLAVSIAAEPETLDALVPPFVLQPLAENAVRHGIARSAGPGELRLTARRRDGRLEVELFNSGPPLRPEGGGLGLRNTRARLAQLFGAAAGLTLDDVPGGVRARLVVPLRPADADDG